MLQGVWCCGGRYVVMVVVDVAMERVAREVEVAWESMQSRWGICRYGKAQRIISHLYASQERMSVN
jgi:hypothetical protein